jgi:hypothetical protein
LGTTCIAVFLITLQVMAMWQGTVEAAESDVRHAATAGHCLYDALLHVSHSLLQAMAKWQGTIEAAEPDVERVLAEEHEEAAISRNFFLCMPQHCTAFFAGHGQVAGHH